MNRLAFVLLLLLLPIFVFAQEEKEKPLSNPQKGASLVQADAPDIHVGVFRFLGAKSLFYTGVHSVHKNAVIKPEILVGQVREATFWYSYSHSFTKNFAVYAGPGVSYSLNDGQGFRLRGQFGIGLGRLSKRIPLGFFALSNITHDFNADFTDWSWFNIGFSYPLSPHVSLQIDFEGHYDNLPESSYEYTNIGFIINY